MQKLDAVNGEFKLQTLGGTRKILLYRVQSQLMKSSQCRESERVVV